MLLNVLQIGQGILDCKQEQERRSMVQQLLVSKEACDSSAKGFRCSYLRLQQAWQEDMSTT